MSPKGVYPRISAAERFRGKVAAPDANGCRPWMAGCDSWGYGVFGFQRSSVGAHRFAWELERGPIPDGLFVLHRCDNPPCVNVDHLWLGTNDENMADKKAKGRIPMGDASGSRRHRDRMARGERHPRAALTERQVVEIRRIAGTTKRVSGMLARRFGVSKSQIKRVIKGDSWAHVR